jgi:IMP-specific 5'-nucleotidase
VQILQAYLGVFPAETLHIGDQFLNTGNDYAARAVSPCVWIINPQETTYVLKSILRLAGVKVTLPEMNKEDDDAASDDGGDGGGHPSDTDRRPSVINFEEMERRRAAAKEMDVYTGEMVTRSST